MAQDFPILFTGKDVSYEPRTSGELEKAGQRFDERILQGEQYKREDRLRDQKFFFETADVDPVQLMSDRLTEVQEQTLNDFNDKWASVYSKQGGTLTSAQKSEMFRDRKAMESKQQQWLASQARYERDYEMIKRDSQRANPMLDMDAFREASEQFHTTGHYDGGLQYTPVNPYTYFEKKGKTWEGSSPSSQEVTTLQGDQQITRKVQISGTPEEARESVRQELLSDNTGRLLMGTIEEFQKQPDEVKQQYLVSGPVDTPEEENAVIRWAQDKYAPLLRRVDKTTRDRELEKGDRLFGGRATSAAGKVYFQADENVQGQLVGQGKGLQFNDAKPIDISVDKLDLPEGVDILQGSVRAYPVLAANGKIEFRLDTRNITVMKKTKNMLEIPSSKTTAAIGRGADADGYYTYEDKLPENTRGAALIKDVFGDLNTHYGNEVFRQAIDKYFPGWETGRTSSGQKWVRTGETKK
jgi:hypothetical protein